MDIMHREIFGPVIVVNDIASLDEGIALANASEYGLTSSIFTRSLSSAMRAISKLRFGATYVNRENFEAIQGFHSGVRKAGIDGPDCQPGLYESPNTQMTDIQSCAEAQAASPLTAHSEKHSEGKAWGKRGR